jgi:hypothetical protein
LLSYEKTDVLPVGVTAGKRDIYFEIEALAGHAKGRGGRCIGTETGSNREFASVTRESRSEAKACAGMVLLSGGGHSLRWVHTPKNGENPETQHAANQMV